ncbi:MAG: hypothetical protein JNL01_11405 [Bdellovibrionales bacterium]|nr:hypothetical protein [Bdellovibrionales bacterium]
MTDCFHFTQSITDFMDGKLAAPEQKSYSNHLDSCASCKERLDHFKKITAALKTLPKIPLPATVRSSPMSQQPVRAEAGGPRLDPNAKPGSKNWIKTPWYIRSGMEGIGIAIVVLLIVGAVPRLRTWYETSLEKRLESFNLADFISSQFDSDDSSADADHKMSRGKTATAAATADGTASETQDEFSGEEDEEEAQPKGRKDRPLRLGNSEVLRFNVSTDQPLEFRSKVIQILKDLGVPGETQGIGGVQAPGGIQFDLVINNSIAQQLQKQLQKLASTMPKQTMSRNGVETTTREPFTWYKVRSRRNIPPGKIRVVIWLFQY